MEIDNSPPFPAPEVAAVPAIQPAAVPVIQPAAVPAIQPAAVPVIQPAADVDAQLTPLAAVLPVRMPVPGNPIYNR